MRKKNKNKFKVIKNIFTLMHTLFLVFLLFMSFVISQLLRKQ
ncbi:MAG: hypothetical protein V1824_00180 [archaeon]